MNKNILKNMALICILLSFCLMGCAHNPSSIHSSTADPSQYHTEKENSVKTDVQRSDTRDETNLTTSQTDIDEDEFYEEENPGYVADPIEPWNRAMFHVNDKFYFWVLKPVSKGYSKVVPQPVRTGINNFFTNLLTPVRFTSCILQGKIDNAIFELSRFILNTTFGILGFGNPTKNWPDLNPPAEDLGQTLGSYGIGNGFYIVWPLLGPSTLRDTVGMAGDIFLNPVSYVHPFEASVGITGFKTVNKTSLHLGDYESIKNAAIAPYEAFRDAYIQNRKEKIKE